MSIKASYYAIHLAEVEKVKELIVMHVVEDVKQGGIIGLRTKYGDIKMVEGIWKSKRTVITRIHTTNKKTSQKSRIEYKLLILL